MAMPGTIVSKKQKQVRADVGTHTIRLVVAEVGFDKLRKVADHRPEVLRDRLDRALLLHECDEVADDRVSGYEEHSPEGDSDLQA
jgi:hypothetical protein